MPRDISEFRRRPSGEKGLKPQKSGDIAYQRLRQLIVSLGLEPGSHVDELSLSQMLGLGRTPIREALQRLSQDNLVVVMPRKGTIIAPINVSEVQEVEELRWQLESLSARWAAERAVDTELSDVEALLESAGSEHGAESDDWAVEIDRQFHLLLAKSTGNRYLVSTIDRLYNHSVRLYYAAQATMALASEEMQDYWEILQAIRRHDPNLAEARMRAHLDDSHRLVAEALSTSLGPGGSERRRQRPPVNSVD